MRTTVAHAVIRKVDTASAIKMPGVIAAITGRDLAADDIGDIPPVASFNGRDGKPMFQATMPVLASERVRYVGEAVAVVIAETADQARDAAEAVEVEFDPLSAAPDVERAMAQDAPAIWPGAPGNIALDWEDGDVAAVDAAFARAAHVERVRLIDTRLAPSAMEPRAAIASFDAQSERYTLIAPTQGVAVVRKVLAEGVFKVPASQIRILTHDVGGGFGMKVQAYSDYAALLYAARRVGRPVKWCATRLESFLTDTHGRDGVLEAELALDASGKFLGLRARTYVGIGAYTTTFAAIFSTTNTKNCLSSVYRHSGDPHRREDGADQCGAARTLSRGRAAGGDLSDRAPDRQGGAGDEYRSRGAAPAQSHPGVGDALQDAERADLRQRRIPGRFWKRRKNSRTGRALQSAAGPRSGTASCAASASAAFSRSPAAFSTRRSTCGSRRTARWRCAPAHRRWGRAICRRSCRLLARRLGIDPHAVRLVEGDSDEVPAGTPSVASRSIMMAGSATTIACDQAIEKGRRGAAHVLEADAKDIEFTDGKFRVVGTDRTISILELAARMREPGSAEGLGGGTRQRREVRVAADELSERMPHLRGRD